MTDSSDDRLYGIPGAEDMHGDLAGGRLMTAPHWIVDDDGDLCYVDADGYRLWVRVVDLKHGIGATSHIDAREAHAALAAIVRHAEPGNTWAFRWQEQFARAEKAEAERDEHRIAIEGCACPAPYDECPHDEPFVRLVRRLTEERDAAYAVIRRYESGWERGRGGGTETWWIDGRGSRPAEPMTPAEHAAIRAATGETT